MQRKFIAAGDRIALNDRDHRQGIGLDRVQHRFDGHRPERSCVSHAQIEARTEHRAFGANNGDAFFLGRCLPKSGGQAIEHSSVKGIALFSACKRDGPDAARVFNLHRPQSVSPSLDLFFRSVVTAASAFRGRAGRFPHECAKQ